MNELSIANPRQLAYVGTRRRTGIAWTVPPHLVKRFRAVLGTITAVEPGPHHCFHGSGGERIWLVPNATETRWFNALWDECSALCFVLGRVAFLNADGVPVKGNPRGSVVIYRGAERFPGADYRRGRLVIPKLSVRTCNVSMPRCGTWAPSQCRSATTSDRQKQRPRR